MVDSSLDPQVFRDLLNEKSLATDVMNVQMVNKIREEMERAEAHRLQPHFIEAFFLDAFQQLGGRIRKRETGRYEISFVPYAVRNRDVSIGYGDHVLTRYERVCFDKKYCTVPGKPQADLICPGQPLLNAVIDLIREKNMDTMKRGSILIDDSDDSEDARLLFYIEDAVQDGIVLKDGKRRVISKKLSFVEMKSDGTASSAGYAPYLDYRGATAEETPVIRTWMDSQEWLHRDVEETAKTYAVEHLIPDHFAEVKKQKEALLNKTEREVKNRLTVEIQYWDYRANELAEKEAAGKSNAKLNSTMAARRADELAHRMQERLAEIAKERRISPMPPIVTGGALVIPKGLLHRLMPQSAPGLFSQGDKKAIEMAAMHAVMTIEKELGYLPKDVSADKCGYDVESAVPENLRDADGHMLRFVEVKGRAKGATTVTVSRNEMLCGLNNPEQFILAIVEVDGNTTHTVYLKHPPFDEPGMATNSTNYDLQDLIASSEIAYQK